MIPVICKTNLDLAREIWPVQMPAVPNVGDHLRSAQVWPGGFQLELAVCRVTWVRNADNAFNHPGEWIPHIEMHMTKTQHMLPPKEGDAAVGSITAFYQWYAPLVGKSVGAFI